MTRLAASMTFAAAALFAGILSLPSPAYSHKPITTNIRFKNEIAPIFQRKCFQCHSDNNLGVSLTTYTEARPWARAIREEVLERRMPPWTAVAGHGHFSNDISLNAREREILVAWADGGAPSGVPRAEESIPPVYVAPEPGWSDGAPDKVLPIGTGQRVEARAPFAIKRFVVATNLAEPKQVRAIALKQGDRRVVRHAAFYEARTGQWLGSWTPWQTATPMRDGVAHRLTARAEIVVEIGYVGTEEPVTDTSELGLYFAEGADRATAASLQISAPDVAMAAGARNQRVRAELEIAAAVSLVALWPHPGAGARSIQITATTPEGIVLPVLWINAFRPEWQSPYLLSSPVALPRGTHITMTTYFDNPSDTSGIARAAAWLSVTPQ